MNYLNRISLEEVLEEDIFYNYEEYSNFQKIQSGNENH